MKNLLVLLFTIIVISVLSVFVKVNAKPPVDLPTYEVIENRADRIVETGDGVGCIQQCVTEASGNCVYVFRLKGSC
ncbi:MAG: hypothetical protein AB7S48_02500 [Bacteroidales bacterium]